MKDYLSGLLPPFQLSPQHTALVVVDLQYASGSRSHGLGRRLEDAGRAVEGDYRFTRIETTVVPNVQRLLTAARETGTRVVYLTVGSELPDYSDLPRHMRGLAEWVGNTAGRREHEILDEVKPRTGELVLNKTTTSGFNSAPLDHALRAFGLRSVVIVGISTNSCVETTARDAADLGYETLVVEDACGAARQEYHDATLISLRRQFGRVATTDEVIAELFAAPAAGPGA
jgi:nicotinamidase-related amidase